MEHEDRTGARKKAESMINSYYFICNHHIISQIRENAMPWSPAASAIHHTYLPHYTVIVSLIGASSIIRHHFTKSRSRYYYHRQVRSRVQQPRRPHVLETLCYLASLLISGASTKSPFLVLVYQERLYLSEDPSSQLADLETRLHHFSHPNSF